MGEQQSLADFGGGTPGGNADEEGSQEEGIRIDPQAYQLMPEDAEPLADDSCPFCCAPSSGFEECEMGVGCGHCGALVPVDTDWYQRGEKICI